MRIKYILLLLVLLISSVRAKAGIIPIPYSNGIDVVKVKELPYRNEFTMNGHHVDLGIMHEQFSLFWIPLYNYGTEKYVLYYESGDTYNYAELSFNKIWNLQRELGGIPTNPELPFWDVWGGKILAIVIIGLIILIKMD